ncbi:type II toxin-antitoxin system RelE/ParE family toxin [Granulicella tundricola]|uniref:Plasmid stabilization system n=1 Tax=Granulicella tundricola (strain ATCC BAA-1859 / DSM 23138 / MP5ACTX9) TaxID=1198114 RepID=E8X4T2_GRATM|nr:type II toxin-antitoxin system RelE/ParE family toxin [Granulicella tundricola]ADW70571.1 plasmid stabilization system [Granulicella tundricola MP5ACTX9]
MSYSVVFSPRAKRQLERLEDYLAERFYPANAERYIHRLTRACHSLALMPFKGTKRDDLRPGIRTIGFERRVTIYFAVESDQVQIISILYGGRSEHE